MNKVSARNKKGTNDIITENTTELTIEQKVDSIQKTQGLFQKTLSKQSEQRKNKKVSLFSCGIILIYLTSLLEIVVIIMSLMVMHSHSLCFELIFILVLLLISRLWKIIYFILKKQYQQLLMCILCLDFIVMHLRVKKQRKMNEESEKADKLQRETIQKQQQQQENLMQQYLSQLKQEKYNKTNYQRGIPLKSSPMTNYTIREHNREIILETVKSQDYHSYIQKTNAEQTIDLEKQKNLSMEGELKNLNTIQKSIDFEIKSSNQNQLGMNSENQQISLQFQIDKERIQKDKTLRNEFNPKKEMKQKFDGIYEIYLSGEKIQKEKSVTQYTDQEFYLPEQIVSNTNMNTLQTEENDEFQSIKSKVLNFGEFKYENNSTQLNNGQKQLKIVDKILKTQTQKKNQRQVQKLSLKSQIKEKYTEGGTVSSIEQYFFNLKLKGINFRVVDGICLSAPVIIILSYWLFNNFASIRRETQIIVTLSVWICTFSLSLSASLFSSIQFIPLRNIRKAKQKQIYGSLKGFIGILTCAISSSTSISLGILTSFYSLLIELPILIWIIYQVHVSLKEIQRKELLNDHKLLIPIRIFGVLFSIAAQYLIIICNFQINLTDEFMEATLPQMLIEFPSILLPNVIQFQNKFQISFGAMKKILFLHPFHSAIFLIIDFFASSASQQFSEWNVINLFRIIAACTWIIFTFWTTLKYFQQKHFFSKVIEGSQNDIASRKKKLEDDYWHCHKEIQKYEQVIKVSINDQQTYEQDITTSIFISCQLDEEIDKIRIYLQTFGGGEIVLNKKQILKQKIELRTDLKKKIEKLKKDKLQAKELEQTHRAQIVKFQEQFQQINKKIEGAGIIPTQKNNPLQS